MLINFRKGLFETNSSSVHSLVMCSESDLDKWKNGELIYSRYEDALVPLEGEEYETWTKISDEIKEEEYMMYDYITYEDFFHNDDALEYEKYLTSYETPGGEKVIAFGYYGQSY